MRSDVVVAGGGPVGLAAAIAAAQRGLRVIVVEKRAEPVDKACGEGILPPGVRALAALGVEGIDRERSGRIGGIRYVQEDGTVAEARLASPGLGVRRTALVEAMARRARALGVVLVERCAVRGLERRDDVLHIDTEAGAIETGVLVGADGLHSKVRALAGLEAEPRRAPRRFGLRRHFRIPRWTDFVEVHFARGAEAYVTPCGPDRVGVAFLFARGGDHEAPSLLDFPELQARLAGATPDSEPRGAGPLEQRSLARVADRVVLVGDAAGYVDAITGEGLSLGFTCALGLAPLLESGALGRYEPIYQRAYRRYALLTRSLVALARRPRARARVVRSLGRHPAAFTRIVDWAVG